LRRARYLEITLPVVLLKVRNRLRGVYFWLLPLCGLVPAIAAGIFSPFELSYWSGKFHIVDAVAAEAKYTPLVALVLGVAIAHNDLPRLLALIPLVLLQVIYLWSDVAALHTIYGTACLVAMILFAWVGWDWRTMGIFAVLLAAYWFFEPALAIYHVAGFLILVATLRFMFVAVEQNRDLLAGLSVQESLKAAILSVVYWSPLLVALIVGQAIADPLVAAARDAIYRSHYLEPEDGKPQNFRADLTRALHEALDGAQAKANEGLAQAERKAQATAADVANLVMDEVNKAIPRSDEIPALSPSNCKFYQLKCHAGNYAKKRARQAYDRSRNQLIADIQGRVNKLRNQAGTATEKVAELRRQVQETTAKQKETANAVLNGLFKALDALHLGLLGLLMFSGLKSFLVVFARVALSPKRIPFRAFVDTLHDYEAGSIRKLSNQFTLTESGVAYWNARRYPAAGPAPAISVPQKFSCAMARLVNRTYILNAFKVTAGKPAQFTIAAGRNFVRWRLGADETVVFHWRDFVAASTSITFLTRVNLRLPALFLGRVLFTCAEGPGDVILATEGPPITRRDAASKLAQPVDRLIAYRTDTEFNVVAMINFANILLNGVHIKKYDPEAPIIFEFQGGSGVMRGISRWIRTFLIPF
jgi:hypothetical protein